MLCPFCHPKKEAYGEIIFESELGYILTNLDPVLEASVMIMSWRHVETPFDLNQDEWLALKHLIHQAKTYLETSFGVKDFNLGWNVGEVAGQHVTHAHLHVIGRFPDEPLVGKGLRYALKQKENMRPKDKTN